MNKIKQTNYHTHTTRCKHAQGSDEAYVKQAIAQGYCVLGFSDHACWKYKTDFVSRIRMEPEQFEGYKRSVLALKEKYKDQIEIHLGMECEYYPQYMDWMLDFCIENDIEYLIFGNHFYLTDENGPYFGSIYKSMTPAYFQTCIDGLETGMFGYLAHPELILRNPALKWDEEISEGFGRVIDCAVKLDITLEYNCLGMQANMEYRTECYPHHKFWELAAKKNAKAIIGMDAHEPADLDYKFYKQAYDYLDRLGIEIVDQPKACDFKAIKRQRVLAGKKS
jgi:histidinol-phosphatase (PHP family)